MEDKLTPVEAEVLELNRPPKEAESDSYGTAAMPKPKRNYIGLWIAFGLLVIGFCTVSVMGTLFRVRLERDDEGSWKLRLQSSPASVPEEQVRELPKTDEIGDNLQNSASEDLHTSLLIAEGTSTVKDLEPSEFYEAVSSSVVRMDVSFAYDTLSYTGIIISEDGYILAATDGLRSAYSLSVELADGRELTAAYVAEDVFSGVCVVKVEAEGLKPASFAVNEPLTVGKRIYCIGNPYGSAMPNVLSEGMLAGTRASELNGRSYQLLQTSSELQSSGYGCPIFDTQGAVIGMTTPIGRWLLSAETDPCFGVSAADLQRIVNELVNEKTGGKTDLGLIVEEIPEEYRMAFGYPGTLWISSVSPNSPFYGALTVCDVITEVDHRPVLTVRDYELALQNHDYSEPICLTIFRDGRFYYANYSLPET